jgi:hypothetical protein
LRIKDSVPPTAEAIEPRDEMKVEVVAAGVASEELRAGRDGSGQQNDGRTSESAPAERLPSSQRRGMGHPFRFG